MGFYDLSKEKRKEVVQEMEDNVKEELKSRKPIDSSFLLKYVSDEDIYIRKNAYLIIGRLYHANKELQDIILDILEFLFQRDDVSVRQTVIYAWGEIGKKDAEKIMGNMENAIKDENPKIRNAIIGALKQMGQKNPEPTLKFAHTHIHDPDPEIRREVIHGIELRGRTHPEDVLPLLKEVQNEDNKRARDMIIHVIGQISYKKGCLEKVVSSLKLWKNKDLVNEALYEILDVHKRYKFSYLTYEEAEKYIKNEFHI
ncbi:MAG: HEAT repeat domain-containing protein [Methanomicrobiales archaeon]